jgi:hypothetical protein
MRFFVADGPEDEEAAGILAAVVDPHESAPLMGHAPGAAATGGVGRGSGRWGGRSKLRPQDDRAILAV